ncbi:hypothetical protein ACHWQZ_G014289 [Mnemiopsis leidyi]
MVYNTRSHSYSDDLQGYQPAYPQERTRDIDRRISDMTPTLDHMYNTLLAGLEPKSDFEKAVHTYLGLLHSQVKEIKIEQGKLREEIAVRSRNVMETVDEMKLSVVKTEQYGRRDTVTIVGLSKPDNETEKDLSKKVAEALSNSGETVVPDDFSAIHRNSKDNRHVRGSTHRPIFAMFHLNISPTTSCSDSKQIQYYSFSKTNVESLINDLESKVENLLGYEEPDFDDFFDIFNKAIDTHCKLEKPKVTKRNPITNPWITDGIVEAIRVKEELYNDWILSKRDKDFSPIGDPSLHLRFTTYRRCLKHVIKTKKNAYLNGKILEHAGDRKKTWEVINEIRGKSKKSMRPQFKIDGVRVTERRIIANKFNQYFASIASKMNENNESGIRLEPLPKFTDFISKQNSKSIYMSECTEDEISKIISELQNGKASDFPIHVIKKLSHILSPVLKHHYNFLMNKGHFPTILKIGKISPIYKKDDEELLENYRPVSTLPIFGKIFEKVIYSRLYGFLASSGILHDSQFGFRKGHSTSHALNYTTHYINEALVRGNHVLGMFIDLSKAFDTIDHEI